MLTRFQDDDGNQYVLVAERAIAGGTGCVCEIEGRQGQVAKIFSRTYAKDNRRKAKIEVLSKLKRPQDILPIALPKAILRDEDGNFCGYVMDRVVGRSLLDIARDSEANLPLRVRIGNETCKALCRVHSCPNPRIVMGDAALSNSILRERDGRVIFVDADSTQLSVQLPSGKTGRLLNHESRVHSPEMLSGTDRYVLSTKSDEFQLAVLLFGLLFGGVNPFDDPEAKDGDYVPEVIDGNIRSGRTPMLTAADWREIRKTVGEECCLLFEEAFSGERVPSVSEWGAALSNIEAGGYKACPRCGTIHMRSGGCPACRPWRGLLGLGLAALAAGMAGCCLSLAPDAVPAAVLLLQNPGSLAECVGRLSWSAG